MNFSLLEVCFFPTLNTKISRRHVRNYLITFWFFEVEARDRGDKDKVERSLDHMYVKNTILFLPSLLNKNAQKFL